MSTTERNEPGFPGPRKPLSARLLVDFCGLSMKILRLANAGVSKPEFLNKVFGMLTEFSGCEAVSLELRTQGRLLRWEASPDDSGRLIVRTEERGNQDTGYRSTLSVPISIDEHTTGLLVLKSRSEQYFRKHEIEFYQGLGQTLGVAIADRRAQAALRERVKELTCLYSLSQIIHRPSSSIEDILRHAVSIIPPAFQFPENTEARITLDGRVMESSGFRESPASLVSEITIGQAARGKVEVFCDAEVFGFSDDPFLEEERNLIEGLTRQVSLAVERREARDERKRLQEQLLHADRLATIGELAAGFAHELNEPLGNILGFAQLVRKSSELPAQISDDIEKIINASLHAREVVKKLLLFSRQVPTKNTRVDLNRVASEALDFLSYRCAKADVRVEKKLDPHLPEITADASQLHQVLVNLAVNSIQAMPDGGRLTVRTRGTERGVELTVEDTGTGMSEEIKERIFLPFFTTKKVGQGTGLGLAVVHGIVSSHRGSLQVESREGKGSRFTVAFPLSPGKPGGPGGPEGEDPEGPGGPEGLRSLSHLEGA